jgi:hypothetical protein
MGSKLLEIYDIVTKKAGFKGRMRLAVRTGISRMKAANMTDDKKTVTHFKRAAVAIIGRSINDLIEGDEE